MSIQEEVLVRLGTQIDNEGMEKIVRLLDLSKLKAMGMAAAFSGLATAVYKFVESAAKEEIELERLARKKNQDIETTRAQETALKAMGKTMDQIKQDKALKSVYDDIVKLNKSLELPNASGAIAKATELRNSFWALRSTVNYAVTAIGHQVLINLERPIQRISEALKEGQGWLRENWDGIVGDISLGLTDFAKGFIGIGEAVGQVVKLINSLPDGVKEASAALAGVVWFFTTGPLGKALMLIPMIGDIIHDWDNYNTNKANGLNPGEEGYIGVAFEGIWKTLEDNALTNPEKFERIASMLLKGFTDALNNSLLSEDGKTSISRLLMGDDGEGGVIGGITDWFDKNRSELSKFGSAFLGWAARAITEVGGGAGNLAGYILNLALGSDTVSDNVVEDASAGTAFAGALGGFIANTLEALKNGDMTVMQAFKSGLKGGVLGAIIGAITSNIETPEDGSIVIDWGNVAADLSSVGTSFLGIIDKALKSAKDVTGTIFGFIGNFISGIKIDGGEGAAAVTNFAEVLGSTISGWGENGAISEAIATGIGGWFASGGNIGTTLVTAMIGAFHGAKGDAASKIREQLKNSSSIKDVAKAMMMSDDELIQAFGSASLVTGELADSAAKMIEGIFDVICSAAAGVSDFGGTLLSTILQAIVGAFGQNGIAQNVQGAIDSLGGNSIFEGLGVTLGTTIATGGNFFAGLMSGLFTTFTDLQGQVGTGEGQYSNLWEALKASASDFWAKIEDIWLGPMVDGERDTTKGLSSIFEPMIQEIQEALSAAWEGNEGGGLKKVFDGLAENVTTWLAPVKTAIQTFFREIWADLYNTSPGVVKDVLYEALGDPNFTKYIENEDGTMTLERTSGEKRVIDNPALAKWMQEHNVQLDSDGNVSFPELLSGDAGLYANAQFRQWFDETWSTGNTKMPDPMAVLMQKYADFLNYKPPEGWRPGEPVFTADYPADYDPNKGTNVIPDYVPQDDQDRLGKGTKDAGKNLADTASAAAAAAESENDLADNASGAGSKVSTFGENTKTAGENATAAATKLNTLGQNADTLSNKFANFKFPAPAAARGGRFSHQVDNLTVGEDGTEYIIPITKPERAFSLISQMLAEMGNSAVTRVMSDFSLGNAGTIGGMDGLDILRSVASNNVSANVYINVNATGSDPVSIGRSAYDAAERHLMKTLRGAYA